jgi:hypothetical protein
MKKFTNRSKIVLNNDYYDVTSITGDKINLATKPGQTYTHDIITREHSTDIVYGNYTYHMTIKPNTCDPDKCKY